MFGSEVLLFALDLAQTSPEAVTLPLAVLQAMLSAALSVVLYQLKGWQRKYDGLEDRLGDSAGRLVDQRIDATVSAIDTHARTLETHAKATSVALDDIRRRLTDGEALLRAVADRHRELELSLVELLSELKASRKA
jgi:septal ring factor EnvC (AmiA/AmiB activator)